MEIDYLRICTKLSSFYLILWRGRYLEQAYKRRTVDEQGIGEDSEGGDGGLVEVLYGHLPGGTEECHGKPVRAGGVPAQILIGHVPHGTEIQIQTVTARPTCWAKLSRIDAIQDDETRPTVDTEEVITT
jgi:hypothetical protein